MGTSELDAQELIFRFEESNDPFRYRVDGICIWPVFRFGAWENLKANRDRLAKRQAILSESGFSRFRAYTNVFKEFPQARRLLSGQQKYDVVVLTTTNRLRDKAGTGYRNIYFDYFDPALENTLFVYADSKGVREPCTQPSVFLSNKAALPALLKTKLFGPSEIIKVRALYSDLRAFLEEEGCSEYLDLPWSWWKRIYIIYLAKSGLLAGIFRAVAAKVFIVDCAYGKEWAVAAAKQAGVPAFELQHGVPDGNIAYFYDPGSAARYKEHLPVPDKILTFGQYFSDKLTKNNIWSPGQMENVGLARLEHFRHKFEYKTPPPGENVRVLITSQWINADRLAEFLAAAVGQLPPGVKLSIKPHPSENTVERYRGLGEAVEVLDQKEEFYDALTSHHIHCSVFSTTILESLGMGVPTVILGLPGSENVLPVTERGYCKVAHTPEAFVEVLKNAAGTPEYLSGWHQNTCENRSYFWEPNPGENLQRVIEEFVKNEQE